MAIISEDYDDSTILRNIEAIRPGLMFQEPHSRVNISFEPPTEGGRRIVVISVEVGLSESEVQQVLKGAKS